MGRDGEWVRNGQRWSRRIDRECLGSVVGMSMGSE